MKYLLRAATVVVVLVGVLGWHGPMLLSSESDLGVLAGVVSILGALGLCAYLVRNSWLDWKITREKALNRQQIEKEFERQWTSDTSSERSSRSAPSAGARARPSRQDTSGSK